MSASQVAAPLQHLHINHLPRVLINPKVLVCHVLQPPCILHLACPHTPPLFWCGVPLPLCASGHNWTHGTELAARRCHPGPVLCKTARNHAVPPRGTARSAMAQEQPDMEEEMTVCVIADIFELAADSRSCAIPQPPECAAATWADALSQCVSVLDDCREAVWLPRVLDLMLLSSSVACKLLGIGRYVFALSCAAANCETQHA